MVRHRVAIRRVVNVHRDVGAGGNQLRRVEGTKIRRWSPRFVALFNQRRAGAAAEDDTENPRKARAGAAASPSRGPGVGAALPGLIARIRSTALAPGRADF